MHSLSSSTSHNLIKSETKVTGLLCNFFSKSEVGHTLPQALPAPGTHCHRQSLSSCTSINLIKSETKATGLIHNFFSRSKGGHTLPPGSHCPQAVTAPGTHCARHSLLQALTALGTHCPRHSLHKAHTTHISWSPTNESRLLSVCWGWGCCSCLKLLLCKYEFHNCFKYWHQHPLLLTVWHYYFADMMYLASTSVVA